MTNPETNPKEVPKQANLLSPQASAYASANIVIYNSIAININLKTKENKPEANESKQDAKPAP
ncbi:MAG: hypothetical protein NWE93_14920 [Candidatus Bathyarchaeota archaeon]|nr:hypothetical protein [Candidatus Bathyarchaeota archaeon]